MPCTSSCNAAVYSVIYYCKGDDVTSRLQKALLEAAQVRDIMDADAWHEFQEYQLLIRVLAEQSRIDESGNPVARDKKESTSSSLQNPSDPDATYRRKAGKEKLRSPRISQDGRTGRVSD